MSKTVMLIHGAWLTPLGWEFFRKRYEDQGYNALAPPWPHEDVPLEELRRSPNPELKKLTVGKIVDHYDKLIRALPEPPILMGHWPTRNARGKSGDMSRTPLRVASGS